RREQLALFSAASIVALYVGLATHEQAERLADAVNGCFRDYDWRREQLALFSAASIVALYVGLATHEQAERLADAV
ncbi:hypothetical protein CPA58_29550, partial [Klebsiella pneumoniae]